MGRRPGKYYEVVRWMEVRDRDALKRWRLRKDLTQRQLAFLVNCSQSTIYQLEQGIMRTLSEKLALAIAKRLDVPWEDLFIDHESRRTPDVTDGSATTPQAVGL